MSILHQVVIWTHFCHQFQSFQTWSRMPVRRLAGSRGFWSHIFRMAETSKNGQQIQNSNLEVFACDSIGFRPKWTTNRQFPARNSLGYVYKIQENILEYVTQHLHWNQNPLHLLIYVAAFFINTEKPWQHQKHKCLLGNNPTFILHFSWTSLIRFCFFNQKNKSILSP